MSMHGIYGKVSRAAAGCGVSGVQINDVLCKIVCLIKTIKVIIIFKVYIIFQCFYNIFRWLFILITFLFRVVSYCFACIHVTCTHVKKFSSAIFGSVYSSKGEPRTNIMEWIQDAIPVRMPFNNTFVYKIS